MSVFEEAGNLVAESYVENGGNRAFAFDVTTILAWIEIIKEVVALWQNCRKEGDEAKKIAENPGPLQHLLLRRKVRQVLGPKLFRVHGDETVKALLKSGKRATPELLQRLIDET